MHQRREYRDDEKVSAGFKAPGSFMNAIHRAAEKQKARSTSEWLYSITRDATAKALGVPADTFDPPAPRFMGAPSPAAAKQAAQAQALIEEFQERLRGLGVTAAPTATKPSRRR